MNSEVENPSSAHYVSPDELEYLSRRHDPVGIKVIRLASGAWALFDQYLQFIKLSTDADLLVDLKWALLVHDFHAGLKRLAAKDESPAKATKPLSLDALDL